MMDDDSVIDPSLLKPLGVNLVASIAPIGRLLTLD
jgi:hypothetical protein